MFCPPCCGAWHGEHGKRRKYGRIVIKAIRAYLDHGGGSYMDIDKLKTSATAARLGGMFEASANTKRLLDPLGYGADSIGAEVGDITAELLQDTLQLTHPTAIRRSSKSSQSALQPSCSRSSLSCFLRPKSPSPSRRVTRIFQ